MFFARFGCLKLLVVEFMETNTEKQSFVYQLMLRTIREDGGLLLAEWPQAPFNPMLTSFVHLRSLPSGQSVH